MSDIEEVIRRRAYELWEHAGMPEGRSEEFWHAARLELGAEETLAAKIDELGPPIVEQGVMDDRIEDLLIPSRPRRVDD